MSLYFRRVAGMGTETMAKIANDAGVSWDAKPVQYRGGAVGWNQANQDDVTAVQDAAETLLGFRPVEVDKPDQTTQE